MRESRSYGSVRGAVGNNRPYRDREQVQHAPLTLSMTNCKSGRCLTLRRCIAATTRSPLTDMLRVRNSVRNHRPPGMLTSMRSRPSISGQCGHCALIR